MTNEKRELVGTGYVDTTTESILSGNGTCGTPCRKKPIVCAPTKVEPAKCKKKECCNEL